ncbi:MAG: AMP-binding protein [Pseudomonadota bacterium]
MNLAQHLGRAARVHADWPALGRGRAVVRTFAHMQARVARLAGALNQRLELERGDRVALVMKNGPDYVELLYACWHAGLAAVPVNAKLHFREIAYILDHSGASAAFVTPELAETTASARREANSTVRIVDVAGPDYAGLLAGEAAAMVETAPDDLAWLFYTSGTTGRPKGAMLSHRNLFAMALSYFIDIDPAAPGGCIVHAAPMSHGSGIYIVPHVAQGGCQVVPESGQFDPPEIFDLLRSWKEVSMFAAPTMVKRLVDHPAARSADTRNLRVIVFGGAPMYVADLKATIARFGPVLAQLYGQGESPMTITGMTRAMIAEAHELNDEARLASAGVPQSVVEVRVADAEDRALVAGEAGEILVRGEAVMTGYWRNPEASVRALAGGWLHTGDIGSFDQAGFLTLKDRSKDLIISGGANIYPREVEEALMRHEDVAEASVIGAPDPQWGESVVAFVVAREGRLVGAAELDRLCLDHIARFKRPKHYRFVDRLPKNNYGKILKTELREWLKREANHDAPTTGDGHGRPPSR